MGPFHVDLPPNYNFSLEKEKKLYWHYIWNILKSLVS
jgi:hypothetical protein